jgi:hypothetical protein
LSITIPLVPPVAANLAVGAAGSDPIRLLGTENDIKQPVVKEQFRGLPVELVATLRNTRSVLALNTSVTGEHPVFTFDTARALVPLAAVALDVIRTW